MTPHVVSSKHEEDARALKVERLVNHLAVRGYIDLTDTSAPDMIDALGDQDEKWWAALAAHCSAEIGHKVHLPSAESVRHIQAELRKRIPDGSDPFDLPLTPADRIDTPAGRSQ